MAFCVQGVPATWVDEPQILILLSYYTYLNASLIDGASEQAIELTGEACTGRTWLALPGPHTDLTL